MTFSEPDQQFQRMSDKPVKPRRRGADSVKTRRQKVAADTVRLIPDISSFRVRPNRACLNLNRKLTVFQAPVEQDDMDALIATHRIQRGLSRVSIKKRKANEMSELEKLHLKQRDLQQELKDKNFQLRCIQQLLSSDITNEVVSNVRT